MYGDIWFSQGSDNILYVQVHIHCNSICIGIERVQIVQFDSQQRSGLEGLKAKTYHRKYNKKYYNFETNMKGTQIIRRKCAKTWNHFALFTLMYNV